MAKTALPEVKWAQRSSVDDAKHNIIYLTIDVPDVPDDSFKLDLKPTYLKFACTQNPSKDAGSSKAKEYQFELPFFKEIDPENSKTNHNARNFELILQKKDLNDDYWPQLQKGGKLNFLKTDFDKWLDEDDQYGDKNGSLPGMDSFTGMDGSGMMGSGINFNNLGATTKDFSGEDDNSSSGDDDDDDDDATPALGEASSGAAQSEALEKPSDSKP